MAKIFRSFLTLHLPNKTANRNRKSMLCSGSRHLWWSSGGGDQGSLWHDRQGQKWKSEPKGKCRWWWCWLSWQFWQWWLLTKTKSEAWAKGKTKVSWHYYTSSIFAADLCHISLLSALMQSNVILIYNNTT